MGRQGNPNKQSRLLPNISLGIFLVSTLVVISLLIPLPASAITQPSARDQNSFKDNSNLTVNQIALGDHLLQLDNPQSMPDALQVLHSFGGPDGASPNSLIQTAGGLFYGTTANGGDTTACSPDGCGVLFSLDTAGNFSLLHSFHATDGYLPTGLIQGSDGNLYGVTSVGGQPSGGGSGTLFRINSGGVLTTLYAFVGGFACCDGAGPTGHPIQASDGNFYGLTGAGGDFRDVDHPSGFGTFYRFNPTTSVLTILHSFNIADGNGIFPSGSLVQGTDGFFYGVTREGGLGGGTIFRLDSAGNITLLHSITDSAQPLDGLIQASDGFFYGTTDGGAGAGTIYRINSAGAYNVVNVFDGGEGYRPHFGLVQAADGLLYGTTPKGGLLDFQAGSLFRMDSVGNVSVIHSFTQSDPVTGIIPNAVLIQGSDGNIYGATGLGGINTHGTIYRFDPSLPGPIASLIVTPQAIVTPATASGTVTLAQPAPLGGQVVDLRVNSFDVVVPTSVTVPEGLTNVSFSLLASQVIQPQDVRLYASIAGEGIRTTFTLLPPGPTPTATQVNTPTPTSTQLPPDQTPPATTPTEVSTPSSTPNPTNPAPPPHAQYKLYLPLMEK